MLQSKCLLACLICSVKTDNLIILTNLCSSCLGVQRCGNKAGFEILSQTLFCNISQIYQDNWMQYHDCLRGQIVLMFFSVSLKCLPPLWQQALKYVYTCALMLHPHEYIFVHATLMFLNPKDGDFWYRHSFSLKTPGLCFPLLKTLTHTPTFASWLGLITNNFYLCHFQ